MVCTSARSRLHSIKRLISLGAAAALAAAVAALPAAAQMQEKTLRVGVNQIPPDLGNPYKAIGSPASYTFSAIFDSLTFVGGPEGPQPSLATSWENVDATTWRFRLRPGITFANGEKFDARPLVPRCKIRGSGETDPVIRRRGFEERRPAVALKTRHDRFFGGRALCAGILAPSRMTGSWVDS